MKYKLASWQKVLLGMLLGIIVGLYFGAKTAPLSHIGTIFLNLIKMITVPLIFFTIIYGITNIQGGTGALYRIGIKAITAFILTAIIAVFIGMISAAILRPGSNVDNIKLHIGNTNMSVPAATQNLTDLLINIIPTNIFSAFVEGHIMQIIVFACFIGAVMQLKRENCQYLINICHQISQVLFYMIELIMSFAPYGVFGYIASTVGTGGLSILASMSKLMLTIVIGCTVQYAIFGVMIIVWGKMSPVPFYQKMLKLQLLAFSTSSSKATLVPLMKTLELNLGVSKQNCTFLLPLSSVLNMDGGAIYQSACAIFFSQAIGVNLSFVDYCTLTLMCTIASIGGAGIPGGVLLFLGMVLQSIGIPADGVLLVASIDRILDMITTTVNVTGDACITLLVDRSEKTLNESIYYS